MSDLYKKLLDYSKSDYYPFHMPGHKRNMEEGINPFTYDITEIDGFDNLHNPQGVLKVAMEEAAKFYGTDKTYYLVNGSTCGLLAAICGVTSRGDKILLARNCHKAVYNAMYLNELKAEYILPEYIEMYGINGGISPEKIKMALDENRDIKAVVITSPTYEGVVSDVQAISEIVHRYGIPLIVDEAHGAHLGLYPGLPKSAIEMGADIIIQSVHKTLPSLTQTALLHIKSKIVNINEIERFLGIYQSSSPSYVLMSSIDECINKIKNDGMIMFEPYVKRLEVMLNHEKQLTHLKVIGREIVGKNAVYDLDPSKIVISVRGTSYTGKRIYKEMLERFHIQLEMASGDYVIAMTSPMDTEDGMLRLFMAMVEIDRDIRLYGYENGEDKKTEIIKYEISKPIVMENIYKALHSDMEEMLLENAAGKISGEYVYLYPPGSPIVAPGELITGDVIRIVNEYKKSGLSIEGMNDSAAKYIRVVKEEFRRINLTKGYYRTNLF